MITIETSTLAFPTSVINASTIKIECGGSIYFDNLHFYCIDGREIPMIDIHTNLGTFEVPFRSLIRNFRCEGIEKIVDFLMFSFIVTGINTSTDGKLFYQLKKIC